MTESPLREAPLLFVFIDISSLPRHRRLCEEVFGFRVVENQFHPPHEHHGLVKYDAGGTILSLNLFAERKFHRDDSDGLTLVCRTRRGAETLDRLDKFGVRHDGATGIAFTDVDGHHYVLRREDPDDPDLATDVVEVRLTAPDLDPAVRFYRDILGLPLLAQDGTTARFATRSVDLVVERRGSAPDGRPVRNSAYLLVFYTADVVSAERALAERGLAFRTPAAFSDIGGTARFNDPSGHVFCLYQPSAESLGWGSGGKVMDLMTSGTRAHP